MVFNPKNMSRIKIEVPDKFIFSTEISPRISDINYGGHLGHDSVLSLSHEARVRFLSKYGYTELDIEGLGLIMADVGIVYKSESFYGDVISIHLGVGDIGRTRFELIYLLENSIDRKEVAIVQTGLVFYDFTVKKSMEIPAAFKNILTG